MIRGREWWIAIDFMESRTSWNQARLCLVALIKCALSGCKKNVEIVLQCTFLVCDCSFSANMLKLPKPNKKKTLYFHLYFRARKKCSLSPINLFQENIWRKHWFGLSAGNFTVREAIFLKVIFSRKILSFLPSYFESWHLSEINSIFWNTCAIQYINCCTSFIQRNGGYFYTFRVL